MDNMPAQRSNSKTTMAAVRSQIGIWKKRDDGNIAQRVRDGGQLCPHLVCYTPTMPATIHIEFIPIINHIINMKIIPEPRYRFCPAKSLLIDEPIAVLEHLFILNSVEDHRPHQAMIIPHRHV